MYVNIHGWYHGKSPSFLLFLVHSHCTAMTTKYKDAFVVFCLLFCLLAFMYGYSYLQGTHNVNRFTFSNHPQILFFLFLLVFQVFFLFFIIFRAQNSYILHGNEGKKNCVLLLFFFADENV